MKALKPFNDQCSHHIETSQLIAFFMIGTLVVKGLKMMKNAFYLILKALFILKII